MSDDETNGQIWGDAETTYVDWKGTAQLDQRMTLPAPAIEDAVGLDRDEWSVVGFEIGGGEHDHDLHVYAVARNLIPGGGDVWPKVAAENGGEIPATDFLIHDVDPYAFLKSITHMFELRMRSVGSGDLPIRVIRRSDVPEQD